VSWPFARPALERLLPFQRWLPQVDGATLRADALAGLVGALIVLPQAVAFATLAGLPPEYGLYCAMVPTVVAALWGSSRHAVSGPTTAVSLVIFATLAPLAAPGSPEYIALAITLAFMSGAIILAMGLFRLGVLVNFISHTVVVGFTAGAGLLIFASQLPNFFGMNIPRGASFLQTLQHFLAQLGTIQPWVVLVGVVTVAAGLLSRRYAPRVPYMIVAMLAGGLVALALDATLGGERTGIAMMGAIRASLPPLSHPAFSLATMGSLLGIAIAVTLLTVTEAISIARAIALRSGQRIDANQEFIGQGLANIAAGFFSGYPSAASFNRSGANYEAGARTPLAAAFSAALLVAVLFGIAPLAAHLPTATVAGLLFLVAWGLIDWAGMRKIIHTSRGEASVLLGTLAATLLLSLEIAILVGVVISLLLYLNRTSQPQMRSLVPDPRHAERKMTEIEGGLRECPQAKILRIEGSIYFGAVNHVGSHFDTLRVHSPGQKHLLLMSKSINFVDIAGAELLAGEAHRRREAGGRLYFYSLRQPVNALLERGGYMRQIGRENIFRGKREAFAGVVARLDPGICATCTARIFEECAHLPGADQA
jgi:SulP family sulfate permease